MLSQHLLAVFLIVVLPVWDYFETKRLKTSADPEAKVRSYWMTMAWLWLATAIAAVVAGFEDLIAFHAVKPPWLPKDGSGFVVGAAIGGAAALILSVPLARKMQKARLRLAESFNKLRFFLPVTPRERMWFVLVSFSAGICEEMLFRGFLIRYLASLPFVASVTAALVVSSVIFGVAHLYQGLAGVAQTSLMAFAFGILFIESGNLAAPMVLHILVDLRVLLLFPAVTTNRE